MPQRTRIPLCVLSVTSVAKHRCATLGLGLALLCASAGAQSPGVETFSPELIREGAATFATFCAPCHGERMENPELFNLRKFPHDQRSRFINSVTDGKNQMPPWRGQLKPEQIE